MMHAVYGYADAGGADDACADCAGLAGSGAAGPDGQHALVALPLLTMSSTTSLEQWNSENMSYKPTHNIV